MASRWSIFHLMALIWWTRLATCMSAANQWSFCTRTKGTTGIMYKTACSNVTLATAKTQCEELLSDDASPGQLGASCIVLDVGKCGTQTSRCTYKKCSTRNWTSGVSCMGPEPLKICNVGGRKELSYVCQWAPPPGNETSGGSRSSNSAGSAVGITLTMLILIGGGVAVAWLFKTGRLTMERIRTTAEDALAMIRSRLGRKEGENIGQQRDSSPDRGGRAPGQIEDCSYASIGAEAIPSAPPVPSSSLSSAADGSGPPPWARHVSGHAPAAPALPDGDYLMPVEEKMKFQSEATARRASQAVSDSCTPENEYLAPVEELRRAQDRYTASPISAAVRKTPKTERYAGSGLPALPSGHGDHTYDLPERK